MAEWYGQVVVAWDSLQPTTPGVRSTHWRNLGYWNDDTPTLDAACRALATKLAAAADVRPGHDVLDMGCGLGESTFLLHERLYPEGADTAARLVGLDLTAEHIDVARAGRPGGGPEFMVGSAVDIPFSAAAFDRVLALECAFHFPDRSAFFAEAHRTLRPGGVLGLADVLVSPGFARALRVSDRLLPATTRRRLHTLAADILKMPTANLIDLAGYTAALRANGFVVRSAEDISSHVFPYFMRHWRQAQDTARQEELLRARGLSATEAHESARAWRRQMRVLMLGWRTSRFMIITAQRRPTAGATGRVGST